jgi:glucan phosphoethanolaminetransferase (alkaline phosphatase superfamily)
VVYTIFVLSLAYIFTKHFKHSFKLLKFFAFVLSTAVIMATVYYKNPLTGIEPFSIPYKCIKSTTYSKLYKERSKYLRNHKAPMETINNPSIYDKVIIIQGESANKHHMTIYGYNKRTTPYLSSLKAQNKLYVFNAIAPANQTKYSIPIFYTKASVHNYKNAFLHSHSILSDFKLNGYKTFWISNQGETGSTDTSVSSIAKEADMFHFKNPYTYSNAKPDKKILQYLSKILDHRSKEMYVLHLMGSHSKYTDRYTKNTRLFTNPKNLLEEYDNTIYYTDNIIKGIVNNFKDQQVLIIYVSDHGEVIGKNKGEKHGHGFFPPYKDEYDIPFVVYSNVENPRIDELYSKNKKGYFNLENLNYIIKYLSGISNDNNISYSNYVFALKPKNIFDYNKLKLYKD